MTGNDLADTNSRTRRLWPRTTSLRRDQAEVTGAIGCMHVFATHLPTRACYRPLPPPLEQQECTLYNAETRYE